MVETGSSVCPACKEIVDYVQSGSFYICTICGRTKGAAEETLRIKAQVRRRRVVKVVAYTVLAIAVGLMFVFGFLVAPERLLAAGERGFFKATGLAIFGALAWGAYYGVRLIARQFRRK